MYYHHLWLCYTMQCIARLSELHMTYLIIISYYSGYINVDVVGAHYYNTCPGSIHRTGASNHVIFRYARALLVHPIRMLPRPPWSAASDSAGNQKIVSIVRACDTDRPPPLHSWAEWRFTYLRLSRAGFSRG